MYVICEIAKFILTKIAYLKEHTKFKWRLH